MGTSPEAFNQVRDILRKLDRSINDARDRRLADQEPRRVSPSQQQQQVNGQSEPTDPDRPLRARPMRRPDDGQDRWISPSPNTDHG
jgi:hypothetical protein